MSVKRKSSYQKLKSENQRLNDEIYHIVNKTETGLKLSVQYQLYYKLNDIIMTGAAKMEIQGLFNNVSKEKNNS